MPLTADDINYLVDAARLAAKTAIMPRFRKLTMDDIECKRNDEDLVTVADRESEALIAKEILARWPLAEVLGEEAVSEGKISRDVISAAKLIFIIDPIDGTWNFARGVPVFGVIISVVENGITTAGVLYDPIGDDAVCAKKSLGAWFLSKGVPAMQLRLGAQKQLPEMSGFIGQYGLPKPVQRALALPLTEFKRATDLRCSCHHYRLLAMGHVDYCVSDGLEPWDHAAGALVIVEAGGHVQLINGEPYAPTTHLGNLVCATSKASFHAVAAQIRSAFDAA